MTVKEIMEKTGVTPGPWYKVGNNQIMRRPESELYENGGGVAGDKPLAITTKGFFGEDLDCYPEESNALLIAAAPEMLEALINILDDLIRYGDLQGYYEDNLRQVFMKATGKTWEKLTK
jgi:hypothetical protein